MNQQPSSTVSCDVSKLNETQRQRRALLHEWLQVGTADIEERPTGFAFVLDSTCHIAHHVEEFIELESLCCPFLRFVARSSKDHDGPVLEIGGPDEAKQFVAKHFGVRQDPG